MRLSLFIGLIALPASPVAAASYLPVGPQQNVAISTVTGGGWSLCYSGTYAENSSRILVQYVSIPRILEGCNGSRLMMAGKLAGSDSLLLLAQARREDVLFDVGNALNGTHTANGTDWYFSDSWSWGFAPQGAGVFRSTCDASGVANANMVGNDLRLCWHTNQGMLEIGWRVGALTDLRSSGYERLIFTSTGSTIPEPASWALLIAGFGLIGAMQRRRHLVAA